eukprot:895923-Pleurochrysis_carterae.AAC.1
MIVESGYVFFLDTIERATAGVNADASELAPLSPAKALQGSIIASSAQTAQSQKKFLAEGTIGVCARAPSCVECGTGEFSSRSWLSIDAHRCNQQRPRGSQC